MVSIYTKAPDEPEEQKEIPVYGLNRIGVVRKSANPVVSYAYVYELTDHLGNVRATVSGEKVNNQTEVSGWSNYYPFGLVMPDRNQLDGYRYGYQGQFAEKDEETGWNAFELRMYDPVIGRWLGPDPYRQFYSAYVGMGNNPVNGVDPDGGFFEEFKNWFIGRGWVTNSAYEFMQEHGGTPIAVNNNVTEVIYDDGYGGFESQLFATKGRNVIQFANTYVIESKKGGEWGITLPPSHIKVAKGELGNSDLIRHEYGHWLQYKSIGTALGFYWHIGIPSFVNTLGNMIGLGVSHEYHHTEVDANRRSVDFFNQPIFLYYVQPTNYNDVRSDGRVMFTYNNVLSSYPGRLGFVSSRNVRKFNHIQTSFP